MPSYQYVSTRQAIAVWTSAQAYAKPNAAVSSDSALEAWAYDAASTDDALDGLVIVPSNNPAAGRWKRQSDHAALVAILQRPISGSQIESGSLFQDTLSQDVAEAVDQARQVMDKFLSDLSTSSADGENSFADVEPLVKLSDIEALHDLVTANALQSSDLAWTYYKQTVDKISVASAAASAAITETRTVAANASEAVADLRIDVETNYLTTSSASTTYETQSHATATYVTATSLQSTLANYLTISSASTTYETQSHATATYVTATSLSSTLANYLTISSASTTYETQSHATATYATSSALQSVSSTVGNLSASGYLRIKTETFTEGTSALVGLAAVVSTGATTSTSALLLYAANDGTSWAAVRAGAFFIQKANGTNLAAFLADGSLNVAGTIKSGDISKSAYGYNFGNALTQGQNFTYPANSFGSTFPRANAAVLCAAPVTGSVGNETYTSMTTQSSGYVSIDFDAYVLFTATGDPKTVAIRMLPFRSTNNGQTWTALTIYNVPIFTINPKIAANGQLGITLSATFIDTSPADSSAVRYLVAITPEGGTSQVDSSNYISVATEYSTMAIATHPF